MERRVELCNLRVKIGDDFGIGVRKTRGIAGQTALRDEVSKQPDPPKSPRGVLTKTVDDSRDSNRLADDHVVQWLPATYCQKRVVTRDFDRSTAARRHLETGLDTAIDPLADLVRPDRTIRAESEDLGQVALHGFFDRQTLASSKIDNKTIIFYTLSHSRSPCNDDQVRVLEPACHAVQVVEP